MCFTRKYIKNKKSKKNQVYPVSPKTFTELGKQILNEKLFCEISTFVNTIKLSFMIKQFIKTPKCQHTKLP